MKDPKSQIIQMAHSLEDNLERTFHAPGNNLHQKLDVVERILPESVVKKIRFIATIRNKLDEKSAAEVRKELRAVKRAYDFATANLVTVAPNSLAKRKPLKKYVKTNEAPLEQIIRMTQSLEQELDAKFGAEGKGLAEKIDSVAERVPTHIANKIRLIARTRNQAVHRNVNIAAANLDAFVENFNYVVDELQKLPSVSNSAIVARRRARRHMRDANERQISAAIVVLAVVGVCLLGVAIAAFIWLIR